MTFADSSAPRQSASPRGPLPRRFLIPAVASIFVMMILVLLAPIMTADGPPGGAGNTLRQVSYGVLFLATVGVVGGYTRPAKLLAPPITMIVAIAWCWISLTWALEPSISIRRLILTTLVFWTIFLAVEECGFDRTIKAMMICLATLLAVNFISVLISPETAIHQAEASVDVGLVGDWKGILPQKNFTGATCALTILVFGFGGQKLNMIVRVAVIAAAGFFLYMTESKTSMGMLALACTLGGAYMLLSPRMRVFVIPIVAVAGIAAMIYAITAWDESLGPFARKDGLTGRVQIWPYLIAYAHDHPITGAGYGSFWNIGEQGPIFAYSQNWVSTLTSGHNGYLDLLVQVGWPGLILAIIATIVMPLWKLLSNSEINRARGGMLIALIIFCVGHNMTETSLFERDVIVGVFLIFAVALTNSLSRRSKAGASQSRTARKSSRGASDPSPNAPAPSTNG